MSVVNFYDDYPTILSSKDLRINQLEQVEELHKTNNFLIGSTIVLGSIVVLMGLYYINDSIKKRKGD
ncbi:hypothetical protein [Winogradskyella alexanderae]|uniref:Uncharacterized protein n=1 Tax=Winogradskyella alexanderae TaxID=2877123 RepID=A0ABS7XUQ1_9FLAO|nr:hypothetical protein [Winogradskyella alexanderae]MCA0133752.1 hypothetical protein [Winogradskyella alexanderae]